MENPGIDIVAVPPGNGTVGGMSDTWARDLPLRGLRRAFSMLELMCAFIIMAIMSAVAIPTLMAIADKSNKGHTVTTTTLPTAGHQAGSIPVGAILLIAGAVLTVPTVLFILFRIGFALAHRKPKTRVTTMRLPAREATTASILPPAVAAQQASYDAFMEEKNKRDAGVEATSGGAGGGTWRAGSVGRSSGISSAGLTASQGVGGSVGTVIGPARPFTVGTEVGSNARRTNVDVKRDDFDGFLGELERTYAKKPTGPLVTHDSELEEAMARLKEISSSLEGRVGDAKRGTRSLGTMLVDLEAMSREHQESVTGSSTAARDAFEQDGAVTGTMVEDPPEAPVRVHHFSGPATKRTKRATGRPKFR
jgi:hypothetical protein